MRGCAGAGSTQAHTPTCMSPPPMALHPRLDLHGFRFLSYSDRAPVFLLPFRPGGCAVWAESGSRAIVLLRLSLLGGPRALKQVDLSRLDRCKVWVWVWLGASSFFGRCPNWLLPILNKWTCLWQVGARLGLVWLEASCAC